MILGADGTSYGASPPAGTSWKSIFLKEVESRLDLRRIHFLGRVSYHAYLSALQVSTAHVYLTYPFVLSWSMLEAMSAGCVVIGSDTAPVQEVIDGNNGLLVPFFDVEQWSDRVVDVLRHRERYRPLREAARKFVRATYDADNICVPQMLSFVRGEGLMARQSQERGFGPGRPRKAQPETGKPTVQDRV